MVHIIHDIRIQSCIGGNIIMNSTDEVFDFLCNCFGKNTPLACTKEFEASIEILKNGNCQTFHYIQCLIKMPDDYKNSNGAYYTVDIEDFDSNTALAQLLEHPSFWSNEHYCRMKCRQTSLLIKPFGSDMRIYITPYT